MTATTTRPLPTDLGVLRQHWMPSEPVSTVTATMAAIHRIDQLVATTVAELEQRDETDRNLVGQLVDAAIAGENLGPHVSRIGQLGDRPALTYRLEQLRNARTTAVYRHSLAQRTDPDYVAWQQECSQTVAEWQSAYQEAESPEARYNALIAFAERHHPHGRG